MEVKMLDISFGKYISTLYRHNQIIINNALQSTGLGSGQYLFLISIAKNPGINQKDLTTSLNIDKATTAKALAKLEEHDYICRLKDKKDHRYYNIFLTEKGKNYLPELKIHLRQITNILSEGMTDEEIVLANRLFEIMIKNAIKEVNHLK
jgi:DNA-binding MarR family transcriptional regulator